MENHNSDIELKDLLIVIVLYKKKLNNSLTYQGLIKNINNKQKLQLFIYDNSPQSQKINNCNNNFLIEYIHDPQNPGVTKAYNQGFAFAKLKKIKWVLLFDQDTNISKNYISNLIDNISKNPEISIISPILKYGEKIVSPFKIKLQRGKGIKHISPGKHLFNNYSIINSALCIKSDLFFKTKGYNENIKLDFSDISFIRRVSKYEKYFLLIHDTIEHELSAFSNNMENSLARFERYCLDARNYAEEFNIKKLISAIILLRGVKLSFRYLNIRFLKKSIRTL